MKFEHPAALALGLALVPFAIWVFRRAAQRRWQRLDGIAAPRLRERLTRSVDWSKRRWKAALFVAGLFILLVAIARPQWGSQMKEVERARVDFLLALDLSRSMVAEDATDKKPRLRAAKDQIAEFIDTLGEDRVGLIAFAGEAYVAAPITSDHEAVKRNLAALDTSAITKQGTDLAGAIKLAEKAFASGDFESKALVLVTDGEELQGDAIIAARDGARKGLSVFTVGVGSTAGARILWKANKSSPAKPAQNEFGREVVSRLNERALQQIAAAAQGFYVPLEAGGGLRDVYERGLQPLGKGTRLKASKDLREHFQWPLAFALALLLGEMLLSERRKPASPLSR